MVEFTETKLEPFGEVILQIAIPTDLSLKTALVFRMTKQLAAHRCLPPAGNPRAELVLDEALTNAMMHGNQLDSSKKVRVCLFADRERWGVIVQDEGEGFGPESLPQPGDLDAVLSDTGHGITLMDSYLDKLVYGDRGTSVMLVRRRQTEAEEAKIEAAEPSETQEEPPGTGPLHTAREDEVVVAQVRYDRLGEENLEEVRSSLMEAAESARAVVLDMRRVRYISSRAIGLLVAVHKRLRERDGILVFAGVGGFVSEVLASVNLDKLLTIAPDRDQAMATAREHLERQA